MSSATWIALWNENASHWSQVMWRACWQGGLFALIVLIVCRIKRTIPATLCYWLWWLVCLKLLIGLCPILLSLPLLPPNRHPVPSAELPQTHPLQQPIAGAFPLALAATLPVNSDARRGADRPHLPLSSAALLLIGWLIGTGVLTGITARSLLRLRQLRRQAQPLSDPELLTTAQEAATAMGIRDLPLLLVTPADVGVLTLGAWNPAVLLSEQVLSSCTPSELRLILAHEFAHLRRGDAWLGLLPQLAQLLFFFHPLAWLACRELELARETTCDEQTLYSLQARPDLYGRLLLKLGARRNGRHALCTPGVSSHFHIMHRRISMLQQISEGTPRRLRGRFVLPVCLVGAVLVTPWSVVHAQDPAQKPTITTPHTLQQILNAKPPVYGEKLTTALLQTKPVAMRVEKPVLAVQKASAHSKSVTPHIAVIKPVPAKKPVAPANVKPAIQRAAPETPPRTSIFRLRHAEAATVSRTLNTLYADRLTETIKIVPDTRINAILVHANDEKTAEIMGILQQLDDDLPQMVSEKNTITDVFPVKYAQAETIAMTLTSLFPNRETEAVKIVPDTRTNTLVIQASVDKVTEILKVLEKLDVPK